MVSGSDQKKNTNITNLVAQKVKVFKNQTPENINKICDSNLSSPLVIVSSAIKENNYELLEAQKKNLEIWHRSDLLAALTAKQASITIAGSHGKTTTSTILSTIFAKANRDPTAVIGGIVPCFQSNAHAGNGEFLIAEADESDGTIVKLKAKIGVLTNIELDHTDHYSNIKELISTMQAYGKNCQTLVANYDCAILRAHFKASAWWSVKTKKEVDFAGIPINLDGHQTIAEIYEKENYLGKIIFPMPGLHNLSNCMGAIAASRLAGLSFEEIKQNITYIKNPKRRFEYQGTWQGRQIVDDYAHHPSEVLATLRMARLMVNSGKSPLPKPPNRVLVAFQPHRYSRTNKFLKEFAKALGEADVLVLAPVYGAGENPIEGSTSENLAQEVSKLFPAIPIKIAKNLKNLTELVMQESLENDLVLSMGAGDINSLWQRLQEMNETKAWGPGIAA